MEIYACVGMLFVLREKKIVLREKRTVLREKRTDGASLGGTPNESRVLSPSRTQLSGTKSDLTTKPLTQSYIAVQDASNTTVGDGLVLRNTQVLVSFLRLALYILFCVSFRACMSPVNDAYKKVYCHLMGHCNNSPYQSMHGAYCYHDIIPFNFQKTHTVSKIMTMIEIQ
jgi:hypothetical protein